MKRWGWILILLLVAGAGYAVVRSVQTVHEAAESAPPGQHIAYYTCAMHPTVRSDHPGDCPICGMKLIPVYESIESQPSAHEMASHEPLPPEPVDHSAHSGTAPDSHVPVMISFEKQQMIGIRTAMAMSGSLTRTIRTAGRVAFDPGLYSAIEEYRSALEAHSQLHASEFPEAAERAQAMVDASRSRLRLLGVSDTEIDRMANGTSGDYSSLLLRGSDGELWVYAQVFENEAPWVKTGQGIRVSIPSMPDKVFSTRIASIDPIVDAMTRTVKIRARVSDPQGLLRPDMYVNVEIPLRFSAGVVIPAEAVVRTGERSIVFVAHEGGHFEPRDVILGARGDETVEIKSGV